ncbi:MAG: hypothetical protein EBR02_00185 [Alphaproteobacteria bacterium]|nr:hypothetical protein [Alphaproteobacteria bacterium]
MVCLGCQRPERIMRPAFIIAAITLLLYQLPLAVFSPLFSTHLPNAIWFFTSIHTAVIINLLWVYATPRLNRNTAIVHKTTKALQESYLPYYFQGLVFWFPLSIFFVLLGLYFYKIPFNCTALYALFTEKHLTLLVREIIGKLMGRTYAPHLLNIITSAVAPITAFLLIGKIYFDAKSKKFIPVILWVFILAIVIIAPLLGGAKGSIIPMAVALSVVGFLVAKNWKWKIIIVSSLILLFATTIIFVKITQESSGGNGKYQFGSCIVKLGVCDRVRPLLESLRPPKSYYEMTSEKIADLSNEVTRFCNSAAIVAKPLPAIDDEKQNPIQSVKTIRTHILGLAYRVLVNPLQVASWHYLYVADYGAPGFSGLSIAKFFSNNYISVPAKVCDIYYSGDKTSTCTAPTSYLFTYPAYLGTLGLLLAGFATIFFDVIFALLIRYSAKPFADLTLGVMAVAVVNLIVADYTTVIISHGAGIAVAILTIIFLHHRTRNIN